MAARAKRQAPPPPLVVSSLALTPEDRDRLATLAQTCTDALGTAVSISAVLRALIRAHRDTPALVTAVEHELTSGRLWGSRPKTGGKQG
jgi:hypothetical protein